MKIKTIGHTDRLFPRVASSVDTQIMYKLTSDPKLIQYTGGQQLKFIAEASVFLDSYNHYQNMIEVDVLLQTKPMENCYACAYSSIILMLEKLMQNLDYSKNTLVKDMLQKIHIQHFNMDFVDQDQIAFWRERYSKILNLVRVMNKHKLVQEQYFDDLESNSRPHRIDKY